MISDYQNHIEDIKNYRDTKSISYTLVNLVKTSNLPEDCKFLYRGDCMYSEDIKINGKVVFHNYISSWTSDIEISKIFSNTLSSPEWYTDESEWNGLYNYPYINKNSELIPVIFVINNRNLNGIKTRDYIDVENDLDYVTKDEKEYILGNIKFSIDKIIRDKDIIYVHLEKSNDNLVLKNPKIDCTTSISELSEDDIDKLIKDISIYYDVDINDIDRDDLKSRKFRELEHLYLRKDNKETNLFK